MPEVAPLLDVRSVSVTYHVRSGFRRVVVPAVKNFSMRIQGSEVMGLIGESGSGKTTITNAILGLCDQLRWPVALRRGKAIGACCAQP
jgi:ABC-type oligopeptide transport system ATPase subunit